MGVEENKANDLRFWNEVFGQRRLEVLDELVSPSVVDHGALPGQGPGLDGMRAAFADLFAGSSDATYRVEDIIAEDDRVVVRWSAVGTHDGELFGAPATGNKIDGTGITINRYENGKIVESWNEYDTAKLMQQLGMLPS